MTTADDLGLRPPRWTRRVDPIARRLFPLAVIVGVAARFAISRRGSNYDFWAWQIDADLIAGGVNIYSDDYPYNYGPIWQFVLLLAHWISNVTVDSTDVFRLTLIVVLTVTDVAIAMLVGRHWGWACAAVVFLNPISIVISGYHHQFDNLAVLMLLVAAKYFDHDAHDARRGPLVASAVVGLSLATKHIGFLMSPWFALRARRGMRLVVLAIPPMIFVASFLPWATSRSTITNIVDHVLLHRGGRPGVLRSILDVPQNGVAFWMVYGVWLGALGLGGIITRALPSRSAVLVYLVVMLAFSPGFANHHLVLLVVAASVFMSPELVVAAVLGTLFLAQNSDGLGLDLFVPGWFELEGHMYAWIQAVLWVWFARLAWRLRRQASMRLAAATAAARPSAPSAKS